MAQRRSRSPVADGRISKAFLLASFVLRGSGMPRPLRYFKPDGVYFITGRCLQARLLLRPSETTNAIIAGVLAKAVHIFDIELFAFVFASNHFHLLLSSKRLHIPAFMQYLRSNIAKKVGQHVDWTGKFWDRRYDAEPVLDDDATVGRLRYIVAHGVKEGLVARCKQWPGLTCIPELVDGAQRRFAWPSTSNSGPARNATRGADYALTLTPLPCWRDQDEATRRTQTKHIIAEVEHEAMQQRGTRPVLGRAAVVAQRPRDKPKRIKHSRRPLCHASTREARASYAAEYRAFAERYAEASAQHRRAGTIVAFPLFSYHPPGTTPVMLYAA